MAYDNKEDHTRRFRHTVRFKKADQQLLTVLMGLARTAGIAGLSGLRAAWEDGGVRFVRPLLGAGREELRDWLREAGVAHVTVVVLARTALE